MQRSSIAVSKETAKALKVLADEIGTTVTDLLGVIVTHKPDALQRAYVAADRIEKAARLVTLGQRRMAAVSGSSSGSRSASASSAPAASAVAPRTPAASASVVQRMPSAPPRTS